ncbi:MAG: hypothetical protein JWS12_289 [Candidatus Saccharibacteria bacterium]|nr:hypothetical protein [Candidatus Saccharibacteria bacterium]
MISPGYSSPIEDALTPSEGVQLTVELGRAHTGDDYHNADVFGTVLHFGGVNYLEAERDRDREAFTAKIDGQVDRIQEIVAPFIGKWAFAKHQILGVKNEVGWDLWERFCGRAEVMHTSGIILGAAGVVMDRTMNFDYEYPGDVSKARESHKGPGFKVGIVLDTTETDPAFSYGVEAPNTDRMLVPVRGFPITRKSFHGIWSWQISGIDKNRQ